jgi:hypothetical protein
MNAIGAPSGSAGLEGLAALDGLGAANAPTPTPGDVAAPPPLGEAAGALASARFGAGLLEGIARAGLDRAEGAAAELRGLLAGLPDDLLAQATRAVGLGGGAAGADGARGAREVAGELVDVVFHQPARFGQIELPPELKPADDFIRQLTRIHEQVADQLERDGHPEAAATLRETAVKIEQIRIDNLYPGEIDWRSQKVPAGYHRGPPSQAAANEAKRLRELQEPPGSGIPKYPLGSKIAWRDPADNKRYLIVIEEHANIPRGARGATALSQD